MWFKIDRRYHSFNYILYWFLVVETVIELFCSEYLWTYFSKICSLLWNAGTLDQFNITITYYFEYQIEYFMKNFCQYYCLNFILSVKSFSLCILLWILHWNTNISKPKSRNQKLLEGQLHFSRENYWIRKYWALWSPGLWIFLNDFKTLHPPLPTLLHT